MKQKQLTESIPKKGERWLSDTGRTIRIMADPVEGYVMYRYKGAAPCLMHVNDWHRRFMRPNNQVQRAP